MPKHPAYALLRAAARALKLPLSFPTDLTKHDNAALSREPDHSTPFAWVVYTNGTHLTWSSQGVAALSPFEGACFWHVWDGVALIPCRNAGEAWARMAGLTQPESGEARAMGRPLQWHVGGDVFACAVESGACPFCLALDAVVELPPPLRAVQPDGTTHVCHPALGCNHGFEKARHG